MKATSTIHQPWKTRAFRPTACVSKPLEVILLRTDPARPVSPSLRKWSPGGSLERRWKSVGDGHRSQRFERGAAANLVSTRGRFGRPAPVIQAAPDAVASVVGLGARAHTARSQAHGRPLGQPRMRPQDLAPLLAA